MIRATRERKVVPSGDLARIGPILKSQDNGLREAAARAVGAWSIKALQPALSAIVSAADTPVGVRAAAIESLVRQGGAEGRQIVEALTERDASADVQATVLAALLEVDTQGTATRTGAWLARLSPRHFDAARILLARVLEQRGAPAFLAAALTQAAAPLPADLAKLCIRQVRASGRDVPDLITAFEKAGRLKEGTARLSDKEMVQLLKDVAAAGDPARGEAIFRRNDLNCLKCHAIAGAGGQVGPGLESIGASAQPDYLVDSLLEPGKAVKENYHAIVVGTEDGKVYTGIKIRQSDRELVLRDAEDREMTIPLASIDQQKMSGSLMPAGLTDSLTRTELIDLVRFLSQLGKIGPYSVGTARVLRRWQIADASPEWASAINQGDDTSAFKEKAATINWRPAYTTVAGILPLSEWGPTNARKAEHRLRLARGQIELTTPGKIQLSFNDLTGMTVWIDGQRLQPPRAATPSFIVDLARGTHTISVAVNRSERKSGIRCELEDVAGSTARAQFVVGK